MSDNYNINLLPTAGASFDEQKQDFIDFLSQQTEFKDYNFKGSRLNVLTNLLTYAGLYSQQYSNAALFESFMRTALKRSSVVQHAQDDGYIPASVRAATTPIRLTGIHQLNPSIVEIPAGTRFTGTVMNTISFDFVNWNTVQMLRNPDNTYSAEFTLVQGVIGSYSILFNADKPIILRDKDIDRNYIRVWVDESEWTDWSDKPIVNTSGGSTVFYIRETVDGSTEIYFGEGTAPDVDETGGVLEPGYIGGLKPINGQRIRIEFVKTSGAEANGSVGIEFADSIDNFKITSIIENPDDDANFVGASGGGYPESTERIRALAPLYRESQRRCVTKTDYETFVSMRFGNFVQAIQCFGDSDRPGYAFIAIKPKDGLTLTTTQKEDIEEYLSQFNIVTITPKVVDPDYLYVRHNIKVNYRVGLLPEGTDYLKTQMVNAISSYYDNEVEIFNSSYHVSKMLTYVDNAHVSILGSRCDIELVREIVNFYKSPMAGYTFMNPVLPATMSTTGVTYVPGGYEVFMKSTKGTDGITGQLLLGPFADGDVTLGTLYTGTDFDKEVIGGRSRYYVVGQMNYTTGRMDYDFGAVGKPSESFDAARMDMTVTPERDNIYVDSGSLVVYEYALRPQYTNFELEAIS
ncbi:baseplate wedge subunit [Vibrio phage EniLVp02]